MYSVASGDGKHPANAIRFANWIGNGQVAGATETGAYTLMGGTPTPSNFNSIMRNPGATVFLPNQDEWYKAAYFDPTTNSYFQYPTSSDDAPSPVPPTATLNAANYESAVNNLTDVGVYSGTTSPVGAFDMAGDVEQWNEESIAGFERALTGGSFMDSSNVLLSTFNELSDGPTSENEAYGFRLASVPEPSSMLLAMIGCVGAILLRKKVCETLFSGRAAGGSRQEAIS